MPKLRRVLRRRQRERDPDLAPHRSAGGGLPGRRAVDDPEVDASTPAPGGQGDGAACTLPAPRFREARHEMGAARTACRRRGRTTMRDGEKGIFERLPGSGVWWVRYKDHNHREHREKVGPKGLAVKVYAKRVAQVAEGK